MMSVKNRMEKFKQYGESLPQAKVYFRQDWGVYYFDIMGKMFGMMSPEQTEKAIITLKNDPAKNEELRELYPDVIIPGYYANKKHWNSIYLASPLLTEDEIWNMIAASYQLVVCKLPKKLQAQITKEDKK